MDVIKSVMLNIKNKLSYAVALILLLLNSCKENEIFSNIPRLEYKSVYFLQSSGKDSIMKLIFSFKDGDGDIGLESVDTFPPFNPVFDTITEASLNKYYFNCYVNYREKMNGVFMPYIPPGKVDTFLYSFRVQNLTPEGRHKAIRGELELDIPVSPSQRLSFFDTDTIIYSIYIYDRSLNKSNVIETPPIIWRR
ncbi:MAG: hypothetical protein ACEQSR_10080 [Candidatus Methylacidiphilales bacterium]